MAVRLDSISKMWQPGCPDILGELIQNVPNITDALMPLFILLQTSSS